MVACQGCTRSLTRSYFNPEEGPWRRSLLSWNSAFRHREIQVMIDALNKETRRLT
jgi:hypothetical protein